MLGAEVCHQNTQIQIATINRRNLNITLDSEISLFILVKSALPGVYLSEHVNTLPCLQEVSIPQRSLTNTVSLTGLQEKYWYIHVHMLGLCLVNL